MEPADFTKVATISDIVKPKFEMTPFTIRPAALMDREDTTTDSGNVPGTIWIHPSCYFEAHFFQLSS
jgi:hypothetical protein